MTAEGDGRGRVADRDSQAVRAWAAVQGALGRLPGWRATPPVQMPRSGLWIATACAARPGSGPRSLEGFGRTRVEALEELARMLEAVASGDDWPPR